MYDVLAMNAHVTRLQKMTKLSIKQYQSCTTPKIHRETIPTKISATNFTVQANFAKNDLHSSNSTPVVHKGVVLLAKKFSSFPKARKRKIQAMHNMFPQSCITSNTNTIDISSALSGCQPRQHLHCLHCFKSTAFALFQPNFG